MKRYYTVAIRFNLDREADRNALSWLNRRNEAGYKTNSEAVIAALNGHFSRQERLKNDPYLETRAKEDAFLERVLDTIREGLRESGAISALLGALRGLQPAPPERQPDNAAKRESMETAMDFPDCL